MAYIVAHLLDLKDPPELGVRDLAIASSKVPVWLSGILVVRMLPYGLLAMGIGVLGYGDQVV